MALAVANSSDAVRIARCRVLDVDETIVDDTACLHEVEPVDDPESSFVRHLFTWRTGSRTVVEIESDDGEKVGRVRINGNGGALAEVLVGADCVVNHATRNTFCVDRYD